MCWIFWGQPWMKTTFLTLRFTTGLKPNISRQLSFPELCVESFLLSSGATTQSNFNKKIFKKNFSFPELCVESFKLLASQQVENKIFREIWVFQNFVFESFILSSGATTQGNFKRNLQKFKNREDVKVLNKTKVLGIHCVSFLFRFCSCRSAEALMV